MSGKVFVRRSRASKCDRGKYDSRRVSGSNLTPQSIESSCFRTYIPYLKIFTLSPLPFLKVVGVIVFHPLCVCVCVLPISCAYCSNNWPSSSSAI